MYSPEVLPVDSWYHVEQDITATGGERYLTIGNFDPILPVNRPPDTEFTIECIGGFNDHDYAPERAYLYVDDVSLTSASSRCGCSELMYRVRLDLVSNYDATGCCYNVYLDHPVASCNGDNHVCTIGSIVATELGSNQTIPTVSVGAVPITIDGGEHQIGTLCVADLSQYQHRDVQFSLRGMSGAEMCSLVVPVWGCEVSDACNCDAFLSTVNVESATIGSQECCYQLRLDGSALACDIYQVRIYEGENYANATEVESARYTPQDPITATTQGIVHTFCVSPPFAGSTKRLLWVDFLDVNGQSVCGKQVEVSCECACDNHDATTQVIPIVTFEADPPGSCCFTLSVENTGRCRFEVHQLRLGHVSTEATFLGTASWLGGISSGELLATSQQGNVSLHPGEATTVGRLCLGACDHTFTGNFYVEATINADGEECSVLPLLNSTALSCSSDVTCDDFEVAIWEGVGRDRCLLPPEQSTWCVCCATIAARVNLCSDELASDYRIDVTSSNGFSYTGLAVPTGSEGYGIVTYVCKDTPAETVTVTLRHASGNIICTKTLDFSRCNSPEAQ